MYDEKKVIRVIGLKDGNVNWVEITEDGRWIGLGGAGKAGSFHTEVATENLKDICKDLDIKYFGEDINYS